MQEESPASMSSDSLKKEPVELVPMGSESQGLRLLDWPRRLLVGVFFHEESTEVDL